MQNFQLKNLKMEEGVKLMRSSDISVLIGRVEERPEEDLQINDLRHLYLSHKAQKNKLIKKAPMKGNKEIYKVDIAIPESIIQHGLSWRFTRIHLVVDDRTLGELRA